MYPYDTAWKWWLRGRHRHLIDGIHKRHDLLAADKHGRLDRRMKAVRIWLIVRVVVLVILSFSIVASIATALLGWISPAETAIAVFRRIAGSLTTVFSLLYFLTLRILGQLEIDILLLVDERLSHVETSPIGEV